MHCISQSSLSRIVADVISWSFFAYLDLMPVTTWPHRGLFFVLAGVFSASGEFTQSKSYQNTKQSIKKGGKVNIYIIGRATVYKARLNTFENTMKASPFLQSAINGLPVPSSQCRRKELSPYYKIIQGFGTHFTTVVTMGAKAVQRLTMTTEGKLNLISCISKLTLTLSWHIDNK